MSDRLVIKLTYSFFYSIAKEKDGGEIQGKYADKAGHSFHNMIIWTVASITGYQALLMSHHLPWWMGGHDDSKTAFESTMINNPYCEFPRVLYLWFLYSFGIFFGELVNHVTFRERKNDFGEMLIHHLATCFLIFGSAYANQIGIGCVIAWLHMSSDIFGAMVKMFASTHYNDTTVVVFFMMLSAWVYFRLICLPFWIYNIFTSPVMGYPEHISHFDIFHTLNGLYLCVIQVLQVYWFCLFMKMLFSYAKTGVAEDSQEKVESKEKVQ